MSASNVPGPHRESELRPHDLAQYTDVLSARRAWWKRLLNTQAPYRWNIRRVVEGRVLDVGCGVGRNLIHLDGHGVGVDSNEHSVEACRRSGLRVHGTADFPKSGDAIPGGYDTLLFAHVLEHMTPDESRSIVGDYLVYLRPGGRLVVLVPQEAGFRSDPTHVDPVGFNELQQIATDHGLEIEDISSFPLLRSAGKFFRYNETVALMRKPRETHSIVRP